MNVIVIDGDAERRAHVRAMVECVGGHARGFETAAHFRGQPEWAQLYLVADDHSEIRSMTSAMARFERRPYVVAYQSGACIDDVVEALKSGASDYLGWPFGPRAIRARLQTAELREACLKELAERRRAASAASDMVRPGWLCRSLTSVRRRAAH